MPNSDEESNRSTIPSDRESERSVTIADVQASGSHITNHVKGFIEEKSLDVEKTAFIKELNRGKSGVEEPSDLVPVVSSPPPPAVPVPRSQRRGLFAQITIIAEVEEPKHYNRSIKWTITLLVALAAAAAPLGSAIFFPALSEVASSLDTMETIANLSVALYMLSMSIFPLWWSSFSEKSGRRSIYLISFVLFIIFSILSAVSVSIGMLIPMRLLSGGASASVQAIGAGTVADIWEPKERGRAMGIFYLGPLCGPLLAPIIGGAIAQAWGWRSTQWFQVIFGGVVFTTILFCLPETLERKAGPAAVPGDDAPAERTLSRVSTRQAAQVAKSFAISAARYVFGPLTVITYLQFAPVLLTIIWASITYGSLYVLNVSLEYTFGRNPYNFSEVIIGLLYIPNSVGYILTSILGGKWMDYIMAREARRANRYDENGKLIYRPEDRMKENAWIGAFVVPAAFIWYGWTAEKQVFWFPVILANFFFGVGSMTVFSMATTMLTEFMPKRASSGVALNNFVRNILSCVGTIVGVPLINAMGNGWLFTMIALLALITGVIVILSMKQFGRTWRVKMDKAFT
ncbi:hypothetical protein KEM54_004498 [Ascosphaera aggregata]|nr:hypothetical protein KEM54_004498 [Ascosphaera aggregata]